ncbi:MAG TPA: mechanosensitive ion channel domain-containing protein [Arachidicoccus sp.]
MTQEFFHTVFLDNTIKSWIVCAGIILLASVFSRIISKALASLCVKFFTHVKHQSYSNIFKKNIVRPLSRYIFWTATVFALSGLDYPQVLEFKFFKLQFSEILDALSTGWLTVCFFRLIIGVEVFTAAILKENASKKQDRSALQMISLLADLTRAALIVICILCVIKFSLKYSLASFVTSLGLVTAALALAAKESVENIICSFVIFLDKPFFVGDTISVNGVSGVVEKIGLRSTLLRTDAKTLISMSNSSVIGGTLENTSNQTYRKHAQTLELDLDTTAKDIQKICESILVLLKTKSDQSIVTPTVYFKETGVNSHKIYMEYFGMMNLSLAEFRALVQKINLEIVTIIQQGHVTLIRTGYR